MTLREALDRKPADLDQRHETVARVLIGRPEGITRDQATYLTGLSDRAFRQCVEDILTSGWLPVIPDRSDGGEAHYRIAPIDDVDLVNAASLEDYRRAVSLHKRARGRVQAFQRMFQAGSLFVDDVPDLGVFDGIETSSGTRELAGVPGGIP